MTEEQKTSVRIVDIARMAGVSVGTVDRVIHNRGKVSDANLKRIREVLGEVDYHPNLMARSLASGRSYTIGVVIPAFAEGEYWADVNEGITRAASEVARYNITVHPYFFNQYDQRSFENLLNQMRSEHFDGLLVATLFSELVASFTRELDALKIPYVFVDSNIPDCNQLAYFGTSSYDAGRLAARLLMQEIAPGADIVLGNIVHTGLYGSNQWRNREIGFRSYLEEAGFGGQLHYISLDIDDESFNFRVLDELFHNHPGIRGAVTFNSRCYLLGRYLQERGREDVRLVGYDVIRRNEAMLQADVVSALIAQRPEAQGYHGIIAIGESLLGGREFAKVNNMPIDILLKENLQFYKNNNI